MTFPDQQAPVEGLNQHAVEILRLLAEGLSDREIAERLIMSVNTIKWYNRRIYSALNVASRTQAIARALELDLLTQDRQSTPPVVRRPPEHNLPPQTTHFIGRSAEIALVQLRLDSAHLLTLVGPPGTGKTRLALQLAWGAVDTFPDGVYFVSLAPLVDPALVPHAIAGAVGINEVPGQLLIDTLKHVLQDTRMLLVLDNFEHLLTAATHVSELLSAAPNLKVLATSREALHLYGEQEYAVPPLELPDPQHLDPQALSACESIALFVQQAQAVRSDFALTTENAPDVAQICLHLEGLPLAIELAAARIKLLTPRTLLTRLSSRLDTLTGGAQDLPARQQTLYNTIAWSYNLLDEAEKSLFARLAVFRGGCSLDAIEATCGDALTSAGLTVDVFDALESLVHKSLIQQHEMPNGDTRFTMLETLHEYACKRLEDSGEAETIHRRHADYFVELAERAEPELRMAQQQHWFDLLETEHENMRAVLEWSLREGHTILGVRLAGALCLFWFACGYHIEGRYWTDQFLTLLDSVPETYHTKLLFSAGHMAFMVDLDAAGQYFRRTLQITRDLGDSINTAWSLTFLGYTMMRDMEPALAASEEGLAMFRELNFRPGISQALNIVGEIAFFNGDDHRARAVYEECLIIGQETGEKRRIFFMLANLAFLERREGNYEHAIQLAEQALRLALEMNNKLNIADSLASLAGVIGHIGQPELAARLLGAWEAALKRMGASPQPPDKSEIDRIIADVRTKLDPAAFEAAWAEGRSMTLEAAVATILASLDAQETID